MASLSPGKISRYSEPLWMPYCQMKTASPPIHVVATEGVELILNDGRRLLDAMASWWCACHGYNHPHLTASMARQLDVMPHVMMGGVHHDPATRLASRLVNLLPGELNHVFFSDSGSTAVEVAMKMAVQSYRNRGLERRRKFVAFANAYHGDTTGAMSLCDPVRGMHHRFAGTLLEQHHLSVPRTATQRNALCRLLRDQGDQFAGVFIEPLVQGAGGMRFHDADTLRFLREVTLQHELPLIADELATGFGRTGTLFAVEAAGIVPDIICLGKSMTAGMIGMAATVATDAIYETFYSDDPADAFMHGPTFMGNPLACAAANASLDLFETEPRLEQVAAIEAVLCERLEPARVIADVVDVRAMGAIGVIQVDELRDVDRLRSAFVDRGIWIRPFGDVIYTTPAFTMPLDRVRFLADTMVEVTREWSTWT